ncbi:MAG: tripartite tricarboxylate transporter substrate binding protein [Pseudolabrys sp.]
MSRRFLAALSVALTAATLTAPALGQTWPDRAIRIVAPFPAGSATDITARLIGEKISEALAQPVIVENRVGAGGALGSQYVARATPDGYTLLIGSVSTLGIYPAVYTKPAYDAVKDFAPIAEVATTPNIFVGSPDLGAKNIQQVVALAKAKPGQLNYASVGIGSGPQLCGELLKMVAGIDVVHVPYKGAPEAFTGVMRSDVAFTVQSITSAMPLVSGGKLVPLAVTSKQRSPLLPDVATVAESGYPDYEFTAWTAILAPAGTPKAVVDRLNKEIRTALQDPILRKKIEDLGGEIETGSPEQLAAFIAAEIAKWTKVANVAGVRID